MHLSLVLSHGVLHAERPADTARCASRGLLLASCRNQSARALRDARCAEAARSTARDLRPLLRRLRGATSTGRTWAASRSTRASPASARPGRRERGRAPRRARRGASGPPRSSRASASPSRLRRRASRHRGGAPGRVAPRADGRHRRGARRRRSPTPRPIMKDVPGGAADELSRGDTRRPSPASSTSSSPATCCTNRLRLASRSRRPAARAAGAQRRFARRGGVLHETSPADATLGGFHEVVGGRAGLAFDEEPETLGEGGYNATARSGFDDGPSYATLTISIQLALRIDTLLGYRHVERRAAGRRLGGLGALVARTHVWPLLHLIVPAVASPRRPCSSILSSALDGRRRHRRHRRQATDGRRAVGHRDVQFLGAVGAG